MAMLETLPDLGRLERALLDRHGRREGHEIRFLCPSHDDTRPSARWSPGKRVWYCDVCQAGGGWHDLARRLDLDLSRNTTPLAALHTPAPSAPAPHAAAPGAPTDARRPAVQPTSRPNRPSSDRGRLVATYPYTDIAGNLLYEVLRFEPKSFACRRPAGDGTWAWSLQDVPRVLYRLPDLRAAIQRDELVFLVEGEKDVDQLVALGFNATTHSGGAGRWSAAHSRSLDGARVVLLPDNDDPGRRHAEAVLASLHPHVAELRCLDLPGLPAKGDVSDWLAARRQAGDADDAIRCNLLALALAAPPLSCLTAAPSPLLAAARADEPPPILAADRPEPSAAEVAVRDDGPATAPPPAEPAPPQSIAPLHGVRRLSDVSPRQVHYLWNPYIPLGKLTLLDGDPGQGKSWITAALAAAGSLGRGLPGCPPFEPFRSLFLCEDESEDILKPRLDLLGADTTAILGRDALADAPLDLSTELDVAKLDQLLALHRPRLVVVDPVQAFLGHTDFFRPNEVRAALLPLLRLAHRHACALLVLRHLTKARNGRSLYAGQGSIDFAAAARSVLLAGSAPNNPHHYALAHIKSNLGPFGPTIAYRFTGTRFQWAGPTTLTANDLLASDPPAEDATCDHEARAFLRDILAGPDPLPARHILNAAREAGIPERTLRRAKAREGIQAFRQGYGAAGVWLWSRAAHTLPTLADAPHPQPWQPMLPEFELTASETPPPTPQNAITKPRRTASSAFPPHEPAAESLLSITAASIPANPAAPSQPEEDLP